MENVCLNEMDLYWFQKKENTVEKLFNCLEPLWQESGPAVKGISICVGWLYDAVLYYEGDLEQEIPTCQAPKYEPWTYKRLRGQIKALREEAEKRNIQNFKVTYILMGIETQAFDEENTCEGWGGRTDEQAEKHNYNIFGKWFFEHPELRDSRYHPFYFGSELELNGQRIRFGDYFAKKLVLFSKDVGIDGVVFRDHVFSPAYIRGGKYMKKADADEWTNSFIALFAQIKRELNGFLIIGYNTGASSMEELRSHGFDLERVARSGLLDMWITQTWASAWQDYWPSHGNGYTFQAQSALANLAMLADTPCKHLYLIETFDAWEPWDSIRQFPQKVRWEIWAYSHLSVFCGEQQKRSSGYYISWMHRGGELLPEDSVQLIADTLRDAYADLARGTIPGGACVVYDVVSFQNLIQKGAPTLCGEDWDNWMGMLLKCGFPVLSAVRAENFDETRQNFYVIPAFANPDEKLIAEIIEKIEENVGVLWLGLAENLPQRLKKFLGIETKLTIHHSTKKAAQVCGKYAGQYGIDGFGVSQQAQSLLENDVVEPIVSIDGHPVFAKHKTYNCWFWETPYWATPNQMHLSFETVGCPYYYHIIAGELKRQFFIYLDNLDWQKPICFLNWGYQTENETAVLLGNLETGLMGNSQFGTGGILRGDIRALTCPYPDFKPGKIKAAADGAELRLAFHKAGIVKVKNK